MNKGKIKRREKKKGESIFMDRFDNAPVGIFDSGVGGLTVAREIARFQMKVLFILGIQQEFLMEASQRKQ